MNTDYAAVEIQDALLKMSLYFNLLSSKSTPERSEKIVMLAFETFLKFHENEQFTKQSFERLKMLIQSKQNYHSLILLDQMLKNDKYVFKQCKKQLDAFFKAVWEKVWIEYDNSTKLENLKLMVKVWGFIYGERHQQNLKKWLEQNYKMKLTISAEHQAQLNQIYGTVQQPKTDFKYQELMNNMDIEQKTKKQSSNNESLLQALGIDQD